ncbi:MAG: transporter substrate-binding domain-containing protein [Coriobacteriia bacterium]|nr:transporter substrate-binding domain-containing protein [Coriobacteriia bacterium]
MRLMRIALMVALAAMMVGAAACTPTEEPEPRPEAKVSPPVIGEEGVLRVGVDLEYPPYSGTDKGREAGIDIDVAAALASELGLDLELVEIASAEASAALQAGDVDIAMSVPFTESAVLGASFAGWYIASGPALFASVETSVTPDSLGSLRIVVQQESESYWNLAYTLGEQALVVTETLREAFEAYEAGAADVVAGDALVCAYLARDFEGIVFASQLEPATPIGIVVATDATELEGVIREALDTLATNGILDTIRAKWVDDLPSLEIATVDGS